MAYDQATAGVHAAKRVLNQKTVAVKQVEDAEFECRIAAEQKQQCIISEADPEGMDVSADWE